MYLSLHTITHNMIVCMSLLVTLNRIKISEKIIKHIFIQHTSCIFGNISILQKRNNVCIKWLEIIII